jgi:type IV pilus assembly protein PilV
MMTSSRSSGFSLVEVLVSIVVLSIGLLGAAGLMGASLRNTNTAYYRSQATVLADDILDRMRANLTAARAQQYDIALDGSIAAGASGVALFDATEWLATLAATIPGAAGSVDVNADNVVTITIEWGDGENSFMTTSQL